MDRPHVESAATWLAAAIAPCQPLPKARAKTRAGEDARTRDAVTEFLNVAQAQSTYIG